MAGYRVERKVYVLEFDDEKYAGMIIKVHGFTVREGIDIEAMLGADKEGKERLEQWLRTFAERIVDWNLEDENGEKLPISYDTLQDMDFDFVLPMFHGWRRAVMDVSVPLEQESSNGDTSGLGSIPMEIGATASQQS